MISLAIMGLIAVLLANTLNFNRQTIERFQVFSRSVDDMVVRRSLVGWIERMPLVSNFSENTALLQGGQETLEFKSLVADDFFWGGTLTQFTITVRSRAVKGQAIVIRGRGKHRLNQDPIDRDFVLVSGAKNVRFSYYGSGSKTPQKSWHSKWTESNHLPDLIKLEWEYSDGNPAPPLTFIPGKIERQRYMSLSSLVPPE
ncbi:hypothetical protein [Ruegeria atlantica]|uniref:hypothetical protein n=1 Tax=Ruegeria atlantica TaxID=81569 RepID=UPI00147FF341|nr:hypothetical protein [Ruegeria atlantica]